MQNSGIKSFDCHFDLFSCLAVQYIFFFILFLNILQNATFFSLRFCKLVFFRNVDSWYIFFTLFRLVVHNVVKNKYQINKSMYLLQRNIQQAKKYIARFKRDENENKLWKIVYLEKWVKDKNCFLQFLPLENDLLSLSENSREYTL